MSFLSSIFKKSNEKLLEEVASISKIKEEIKESYERIELNFRKCYICGQFNHISYEYYKLIYNDEITNRIRNDEIIYERIIEIIKSYSDEINKKENKIIEKIKKS
jgi:hypothetical protein